MDDRIILETNFRRVAQDEFEKIDYVVTGECFRIQNEIGRFFDEKIYRDELANRLTPLFSKVQTEAPITARLEGFRKPYFADLVINDSVIYELKVANSITSTHSSQALNYLFLTELAHGKVVNFGSQKVETEFVSTTLDHQTRREFKANSDLFDGSNERSEWFWKLLQRSLKHFGSFLNTSLFYDVINHFSDWEIVGNVQVNSSANSFQRAHLLSPQIAFKLTSYPGNLNSARIHLQKFLNHTSLRQIHWVNIYRHQITASTLTRREGQNHRATE